MLSRINSSAQSAKARSLSVDASRPTSIDFLDRRSHSDSFGSHTPPLGTDDQQNLANFMARPVVLSCKNGLAPHFPDFSREERRALNSLTLSLNDLARIFAPARVDMRGSAARKFRDTQATFRDVDFSVTLPHSWEDFQAHVSQRFAQLVLAKAGIVKELTDVQKKALFAHFLFEHAPLGQGAFKLRFNSYKAPYVDITLKPPAWSLPAFDEIGASFELLGILSDEPCGEGPPEALVEWLHGHGLRWFSPGIQGGAGRLAKRRQEEVFKLVQPTLLDSYFAAMDSAERTKTLRFLFQNDAALCGQALTAFMRSTDTKQEALRSKALSPLSQLCTWPSDISDPSEQAILCRQFLQSRFVLNPNKRYSEAVTTQLDALTLALQQGWQRYPILSGEWTELCATLADFVAAPEQTALCKELVNGAFQLIAPLELFHLWTDLKHSEDTELNRIKRAILRPLLQHYSKHRRDDAARDMVAALAAEDNQQQAPFIADCYIAALSHSTDAQIHAMAESALTHYTPLCEPSNRLRIVCKWFSLVPQSIAALTAFSDLPSHAATSSDIWPLLHSATDSLRDIELLLKIAHLQIHHGQATHAARTLKSAASLQPSPAQCSAIGEACDLLIENNGQTQGMALLETLQKSYPQQSLWAVRRFVQHAREQLDQRDYNRALACAGAALRLEPSDTAAQIARGRAYFGLLRFSEAQADFLNAAASGDKQARLSLANCYTYNEQRPLALDILRALEAEFPQSLQVAQQIALLYRSWEECSAEESADHLEKLTTLHQDDNLLAKAYFEACLKLPNGERTLQASLALLTLCQRDDFNDFPFHDFAAFLSKDPALCKRGISILLAGYSRTRDIMSMSLIVEVLREFAASSSGPEHFDWISRVIKPLASVIKAKDIKFSSHSFSPRNVLLTIQAFSQFAPQEMHFAPLLTLLAELDWQWSIEELTWMALKLRKENLLLGHDLTEKILRALILHDDPRFWAALDPSSGAPAHRLEPLSDNFLYAALHCLVTRPSPALMTETLTHSVRHKKALEHYPIVGTLGAALFEPGRVGSNRIRRLVQQLGPVDANNEWGNILILLNLFRSVPTTTADLLRLAMRNNHIDGELQSTHKSSIFSYKNDRWQSLSFPEWDSAATVQIIEALQQTQNTTNNKITQQLICGLREQCEADSPFVIWLENRLAVERLSIHKCATLYTQVQKGDIAEARRAMVAMLTTLVDLRQNIRITIDIMLKRPRDKSADDLRPRSKAQRREQELLETYSAAQRLTSLAELDRLILAMIDPRFTAGVSTIAERLEIDVTHDFWHMHRVCMQALAHPDNADLLMRLSNETRATASRTVTDDGRRNAVPVIATLASLCSDTPLEITPSEWIAHKLLLEQLFFDRSDILTRLQKLG